MPKSWRSVTNVLAVAALILLGGGAVLHIGLRLGDVQAADTASVRLRDQDDAARSLADWRGQFVVLDFIYTGCGDTCPLKTAQLAGVQAALDPALRPRVHFVSVSVDPEHDDSAALKAYAARTGADLSSWSFLTGDLSKIARFVAAFDPMPPSSGDMPSHITTVRLLAPDGRVLQRYVGEPVDDRRLEHDLLASAAPELAIH